MPGAAVTFAQIAREERKRVIDGNQELISAARPSIESLAAIVGSIGYFAMLTDVQGIVIDVAGEVSRSNPIAATIAQVGVDLSERAAGTNAICAALTELHPVWLHRGEHFFEATGVFSCAGAPLFDGKGHCIGMLDLTGINVREHRQLTNLVSLYASEIERTVFLRQPHCLQLRVSWPTPLGSTGQEMVGLISCNEIGEIIGADSVARQTLPELEALKTSTLHCTDLFAVPWQSLFDLAARSNNSRELPLWSGLTIRVAASRSQHDSSALRTGRNQMPDGTLKNLETELIHKAVHQARGNVQEAANQLGISRATVYRKLKNR
jgi:sigma-54 dependent transcriptional regulator, acetoin dehydrogenase operon transcriptional activator AcoR